MCDLPSVGREADGIVPLHGGVEPVGREDDWYKVARGVSYDICYDSLRRNRSVHPSGLPTYCQTRSAVMSISIQPWHGPLKMSVCMTPASVPLAWGV
jgi:hypothetical protein